MNKKQEELEKVCFNCNEFLLIGEGPTEYGICLNDTAFEPYLEELLEKQNYDCCQTLIEEKKINGNNEACENFTPAEKIEIPDEIAEQIEKISKTRELTADDIISIRNEFLLKQLDKVDWKNYPVEEYEEDLYSGDEEKIKKAIEGLHFLIGWENNKAFTALMKYFENLPAPHNIERVHFKIEILEKLDRLNMRNQLSKCLIKELYKTPSNNTTRGLIAKVFEILSSIPLDDIKEDLEKMLKERRFSYKFKQKVKNLLLIHKYRQREKNFS